MNRKAIETTDHRWCNATISDVSSRVAKAEAQLARAEKVMRQIADMEGQEGMTDSLFAARTLAMVNAHLAEYDRPSAPERDGRDV